MNWEFYESSHAAVRWAFETSTAALALLVVYIILEALPGRVVRPRWRYAMGLLVIVRLLLPSSPESALSIWNLSPPPTMISSGIPTTSLVATSGVMKLEPIAGDSPAGANPWPIAQVLNFVWFAGVAGVLALAFYRWAKVAHYVKRCATAESEDFLKALLAAANFLGLKRVPRVVISDPRAVPALFGFFRPALLWPDKFEASLPPAELRMALIHELSHLRRMDAVVNLFALAACALHWFNPLVWLATRRLSRTQEYLSDAAVLGGATLEERQRYGQTLLQLASGRAVRYPQNPALLPFLQRNSEIKRRVKMMLTYRKGRWIEALLAAVILGTAGAVTFTNAAQKEAPVAADHSPAEASPLMKPANAEDPTAKPKAQNKREELEREVTLARDEERDLRWRMREMEQSLVLGAGSETIKVLESQRVSALAKRLQIEGQLDGLKVQVKDRKWAAVLAAQPDATLQEALDAASKARRDYAAASTLKGNDHPELVSLRAQMAAIEKQLEEQAKAILEGLEVQRGIQENIENRMSKMLDRTQMEFRKRNAETEDFRRRHEEALQRYEQLQKRKEISDRPRF